LKLIRWVDSKRFLHCYFSRNTREFVTIIFYVSVKIADCYRSLDFMRQKLNFGCIGLKLNILTLASSVNSRLLCDTGYDFILRRRILSMLRNAFHFTVFLYFRFALKEPLSNTINVTWFFERNRRHFFTTIAQGLDENGMFYFVTSFLFLSAPNGVYLSLSLIMLSILTGTTAVNEWYTQLYAFHDRRY
jgi:hypothetical protein